MEAVSRAFHETAGRTGLVLGILPAGRGSGYPNRWVEIPVRTHLPLSGDRGREPMSRNHINVLTSDLVVALPGGAGTESEVALALEYGCRLIVAAGEDAPKRRPAPGLSLAGNPAEMEALIGEALDCWNGSGSTVADGGA